MKIDQKLEADMIRRGATVKLHGKTYGYGAPPVKGHKYRAKRTTVDGIVFASKKEAKRYGELKLLEKSGKISNLRLQPVFPMWVKGCNVGTYKADFQYFCAHHCREIVEDVKGYRTPVYRLKKKIVEALYGIEIQEV